MHTALIVIVAICCLTAIEITKTIKSVTKRCPDCKRKHDEMMNHVDRPGSL